MAREDRNAIVQEAIRTGSAFSSRRSVILANRVENTIGYLPRRVLGGVRRYRAVYKGDRWLTEAEIRFHEMSESD